VSIDQSIRPITSKFKLFPPDSLDAVGFTTNIDQQRKFGVRLSTLVHKGP
jgi:hypothetical protein